MGCFWEGLTLDYLLCHSVGHKFMPTFSVVGTPIGNLEDITLRALKVLASADLILCEDTRVTKKLLDRHNIKTKTLSYHAHSKISRVEEIVGLLRADKNIALVSD